MKTKLKEIRKSRNITQDKMAEYLHVTNTTYRNYESGYTEPDLETLIKIATILNASIDELLGYRQNTITINKNEYERLKEISKELNDILK